MRFLRLVLFIAITLAGAAQAAIKTPAQLSSELDSTIYPNSTYGITPQSVNQFVHDVLDSAFSNPQAFTGTNLYPVFTQQYDANSSYRTNTLGVKNILAGKASNEAVPWVNTYQPGTVPNAGISVFVEAPTGFKAGVFASRTSDGTGGRAVALNPLAVCDATTGTNQCDAEYLQMNITPGASYSSAINEWSIGNASGTDACAVDPFTPNCTGQVELLRPDCGLNGSGNTWNDCSAIFHSLSNVFTGQHGTFRAGWVVDKNTFDTTYDPQPCIICFAANQAFTAYSSAGVQAWKSFYDGTDYQFATDTTGELAAYNTGTYQIKFKNTSSGQVGGIGVNSAGIGLFGGPQGIQLATGAALNQVQVKITGTSITLFDPLSMSCQVHQPTGSAYTVGTGVCLVYLDSGSGTFAVTLPAAPADQQDIEVICTKAFATFSWVSNSGQTLASAATTCPIHTSHKIRYDLASTTWNTLY